MPPPEPRSSTVSPALQFGQRRRIAAAQRRQHRLFGKTPCLGVAVKIGRDRIDAVPQAETAAATGVPCPDATRSAACAVFLFHYFFDVGRTHICSFTCSRRWLLRFDRLVARAALRVEKAQQFLQRVRVGRVPEERALAAHA